MITISQYGNRQCRMFVRNVELWYTITQHSEQTFEHSMRILRWQVWVRSWTFRSCGRRVPPVFEFKAGLNIGLAQFCHCHWSSERFTRQGTIVCTCWAQPTNLNNAYGESWRTLHAPSPLLLLYPAQNYNTRLTDQACTKLTILLVYRTGWMRARYPLRGPLPD